MTHDTEPPHLFIDFPADGAQITTATTDVAGRVGDMLSGFMGLQVQLVVNGDTANPIDAVFDALYDEGFNVAMVSGTAPDSGSTGSISGTVTTSSDESSDISGATVTVDTGQSATTEANGTYIIADVPTGDRSVTASATGFESNTEPATVYENSTTTVDFDLTEATEPSQTIVNCVIYDTEGGRNHKHLLITIRVEDDFGNLVSGAEVRIDVDLDGEFFGSGSGAITDANGETTYTAKNAPNGDYVTTVTDVISDLPFERDPPRIIFSARARPTPPSRTTTAETLPNHRVGLPTQASGPRRPSTMPAM